MNSETEPKAGNDVDPSGTDPIEVGTSNLWDTDTDFARLGESDIVSILHLFAQLEFQMISISFPAG